jgi:hypothetical protein
MQSLNPDPSQLDHKKVSTCRPVLRTSYRSLNPWSRRGSTQPDGGGATIDRLDLPGEMAAPLAQLAEVSERTMPGQIRFALKAWLSGQGEGWAPSRVHPLDPDPSELPTRQQKGAQKDPVQPGRSLLLHRSPTAVTGQYETRSRAC